MDGEMPFCPSARHDTDGAVIIGVVGGTPTRPRMAHLVQPLPVMDDLLALTGPVSPEKVYRFAAPCAASACLHFAENHCRLVERVVDGLPEAVEGLPNCRIRPTCRWWQQEGKAACLRCPMIVTEVAHPSEELYAAASPELDAAAGEA